MSVARIADALSPADVLRARGRIAGVVARTPLRASPSLSERAGVPVAVKWEQQQITGSFKLRGATNAVASLSEAERARGIVGVSTGNHGRALAHAAKAVGARCTIFMSELVPANKVDAIRALGAEVAIGGRSQDEAQERAETLVRAEQRVMLPPFDHRDIIAGQGTLALEVLEDAPDTATLVVPVSGGGLVSGVALMAKALNPAIRILGVSMRRGAAMHASIAAGRPVQVEELPTLADSLGGGIGLDNRYTFGLVQALVDDIVLVDETEIAAGIRHAYACEQEVIEGSGAVGIAALLAGRLRLAGPAVVLCCGRNIDMALHRRIIDGETPDVGGAG
ncbi:MAG: hydroxyectoine utilization dehydratase EutB [Alphaproteobacteria bacterium]